MDAFMLNGHAYSIAAWLYRADQDGSLGAFLKPDLTPPERAVAQVEGWILGRRNATN
jgi:hypothetical protein